MTEENNKFNLSNMSSEEKEAHIEAIEMMIDYGNGSVLTNEDMELYNQLIAERNQRIVKSQTELDSIPSDFNGNIIIDFGTAKNKAVLRNQYKGDVFVKGENYVTVYNSIIIAQDSSRVEAFTNSHVEARDNSVVWAYNSKVIAKDNSSIDAWHSSKVIAHNNSQVELHDYSSVERVNEKNSLDEVISAAEQKRNGQDEIDAVQIDRETR